MVKLTRLLVASVCIMLTASVVVAVVAVIFHPTRSRTAILIKELQTEVTCAECRANSDWTSSHCEKCEFPQPKHSNDAERDCELTKNRRKDLKETIEAKMTAKTTKLKETIKDVVAKKNVQQVADEISRLNLNVPRPSAHWYLKNNAVEAAVARTRKPRSAIGSLTLNISSWVWRTETEIAHTQNGIDLRQDGLMNLAVPGWYHIYFQMDFRSGVREKSSYKARVFVQSKKGQGEKNHLMTRHEIKSCGHGSHQSSNHSCVVLSGSGTFKINEDDNIRVQVEMPRSASLHTEKSRSYFGALYQRHVDWVRYSGYADN